MLLPAAPKSSLLTSGNVLILNSKADGTKQRKAIEQYFLVVLFIMLYKVVLTFESV